MDKVMNFSVVLTCVMLFFTLQSSSLLAANLQEYRGEADQYYVEQNYRKAYKIYFKLAKMGDHYSQGQLATMYAKGEGKKTDLEEAYAWSMLAAEGRDELLLKQSDELLLQVSDQSKAEKKAAKLKKKYGETALKEKADRRATRMLNHEMGGCTGSKLGCAGG